MDIKISEKSPSQTAKNYGFDGWSHFVRLSGLPDKTLKNWIKNDQRKFDLIAKGVIYESEVITCKQS